MKKSLAMLMTLLFVLLGTTAWAQSYTAGVYTAQANGNNGPVTVEVEVSDAEILSVKVTEHAETAGLSDTPIERIPAKIVEGQTLAVDTVSGATNTSNAILKAAEDALAQAGADIEALKAVQEKDETAGETAERHVQALVIGAGGSGLAAAITLQEQGIETLVVDKMANAGGATALTGALINGGCSKQQAERGVTDDVQTMFMDAMVYGSFQNDARMTWLLVNNTGDSVDWLHDTVGVEFEEAINHFPEHTNDRAFYPKGKLPGYLTGTMEQHYLSNGGELLLETRAQHLLTEDGRVIGASCSTADGTLNIYADVTLLATGGYGASVALRPADQMGTLFYGASASTGDGIIMAEEVGAMTHYMQYLKSYPQGIEKPLDGGNITADGTTFRGNAYISPLASQAVTLNDGAIYVNVEGERCMNENMDFVSIKKVTQKQTDMTVYLVMDQKGYDKWMGMMEVSAGLTPEIVAPWLDAFCAELGIPRKYVDAVQFHHSPDETYQVNTDGESSTLYRSFDIYTTFQYKLPAITLWKEESKVANIIATLLVLNPDVYVDLSLTYLGYGVNPAIYHAGDVNWDGVIDVSDAVLLSKIVTTGTQCQYVTLADCDGNGEVDSRDVVALMKFLIHLVDTLPCAE